MVAAKRSGFTLVEVLVVMAIVAMLMSVVAPRYFAALERSKESILRHDLAVMRDAIDKYYSDKGKYPYVLEELVEAHYLRHIPEDPITESTETWITVPPADPAAEGTVFDIQSGAEGMATDGTFYAEW
jgi:general secretion pathway protein G